MAINGITTGPDGSSGVQRKQVAYIDPTNNIKPNSPKVTDQTLRDAHVVLTEMTEQRLTGNERYLFGQCREILLGIAEDRIPTNRNQMKRQLQILKKVQGLLKNGKPIPRDIVVLYRARHRDIERNIKAYVAKKEDTLP